jgi:hypothetical protein
VGAIKKIAVPMCMAGAPLFKLSGQRAFERQSGAARIIPLQVFKRDLDHLAQPADLSRKPLNVGHMPSMVGELPMTLADMTATPAVESLERLSDWPLG